MNMEIPPHVESSASRIHCLTVDMNKKHVESTHVVESSASRLSDEAMRRILDMNKKHVESTHVECSASRLSDEAMRRIHQNWMRKYHYEYDEEEEEERRYKIFKETFEEIEKHNTEEESCLFLLSRYSDRTDAEFFALYSDIDKLRGLPKDMRDDYYLRKSRRRVPCEACKRRIQFRQLEEELKKKKQQRISEEVEV